MTGRPARTLLSPDSATASLILTHLVLRRYVSFDCSSFFGVSFRFSPRMRALLALGTLAWALACAAAAALDSFEIETEDAIIVEGKLETSAQ